MRSEQTVEYDAIISRSTRNNSKVTSKFSYTFQITRYGEVFSRSSHRIAALDISMRRIEVDFIFLINPLGKWRVYPLINVAIRDLEPVQNPGQTSRGISKGPLPLIIFGEELTLIEKTPLRIQVINGEQCFVVTAEPLSTSQAAAGTQLPPDQELAQTNGGKRTKRLLYVSVRDWTLRRCVTLSELGRQLLDITVNSINTTSCRPDSSYDIPIGYKLYFPSSKSSQTLQEQITREDLAAAIKTTPSIKTIGAKVK